MKVLFKYFILIIALTFFHSAYSQLDSIQTPDGIRKFIVHLPKNYNSINKYPLVLNYHGLASNAAQQQVLAGMDPVSDAEGFIVVYPEGIGAN
jgi:polyhydroxybutyrate depolymerase